MTEETPSQEQPGKSRASATSPVPSAPVGLAPEEARKRRVTREAEVAHRRCERSLEPRAESEPDGSPDPLDAIAERDFEIDYQARPEDVSPYEEDV